MSAYSLTDPHNGFVIESGDPDEGLLDDEVSDSTTAATDPKPAPEEPNESTPINVKKNKPKDLEEESEQKEIRLKAISKYNVRFHLVMCLCSIYLAMLLTAWSTPEQANNSEDNGTDSAYDLGEAAYWIKLVTLWVTESLYIYTLVAPLLFPDREFA